MSGDDGTARATRALVWVTGGLVLLNVALIVVTYFNQQSANNAELAREARAGEGVASVYLARVQQEKKGLVDMWLQRETLDPYLPTPDFDLSVSDGVALQAASAPDGTIPALGSLYGKLLANYPVLLKYGGHQRLEGWQRLLICDALSYTDAAEGYLMNVQGVLYDPKHDAHLRFRHYWYGHPRVRAVCNAAR